MKDQVKTPVVVAVVVAVVALVVWFGMKGMSSGDLDQGQVKYTPGKPPWEETDPAKRGPGGAPAGAPPPGGGPPGVSAPVVNNQ